MKKQYALLAGALMMAFFTQAQLTVRVYGKVTDVNNNPVDSASVWLKQRIDDLSLIDKDKLFENRYETFTDSKGNFSINVEPGTYYCLYAIKERDYAKSKLEYWAWNLPIYRDLEINPKYDRMEIYGINGFEPQMGPFRTYTLYFRPMGLTKALQYDKNSQSDTIDIAPETIGKEELQVKVNGLLADVVAIDKIKEYAHNGKYMYAYIVQIVKPDMAGQNGASPEHVDGFDKITIELTSKETNEYGMGEYFLKKIGQ